MNEKLDKLLYDSLKPADEPDAELNRQILERRSRNNMRKSNWKKTIAAAAACCVIVIGGVGVYAATTGFSLLSLFQDESKQVQEKAIELIDTEIKQEEETNEELTQWATFDVTEAICDNNQVYINVTVTAVDPEKYVLIPDFMDMNLDPMSDLELTGEDSTLTAAEYAKKYNKTCLPVNVGIDCGAASQSIRNALNADGTLQFIIHFDNVEKTSTLEYACHTIVHPVGSTSDTDIIRDTIPFTLEDKSSAEEIKYLPITNEKVEGTELIVDDVTFINSDLEMVCKISYHYTGDKETWESTTEERTKDQDICFFMLDEAGNIIEASGGGGSEIDGMNVVQSMQYSLSELPDTITFVAKDVFEKNLYGEITVTRAE